MRRSVLITIAMLLAFPAFCGARDTIFNKDHLNVSVHGRYQHMIYDSNMYANMLDSYGSVLAGVQVGLDTHPSDSSWWSNAYNYPSLALGFSYDNTGLLKAKPGAHMGTSIISILLRSSIFSVPESSR